MMRVLMLVHHWPPDVNTTGLLMGKLATRLSAKGHSVDVISTFPHYQGFRVWPEYRRKLKRTNDEQGVRVTRVYSFTSGNKSMLHRLLNYLTYNVLVSIVAVFGKRRFDIVFCPNGSFFSGISGRLAGWRHRARVVYNVQDLYPDVPVDQGQLTDPLQIKLLGAIERFMYRRADLLTVITPSFAETIVQRGIEPSKIQVIPNFVDTEFIRPLDKTNRFSERWGMTDRVVITHAGNIGYVYDLATLLQAAAHLRNDPDLLFLIVGEGVAKAGLERSAEGLGLDNVTFLPFQPLEDLPYMRASSDIQVALYREGASRSSMPSKVYEIMASGRPVLASGDRESDLRALIDTSGCGIYVPSGDVGALAEAIDRLRDADLRREMGERGRREAERNYSIESISQRYEAVFARLCK